MLPCNGSPPWRPPSLARVPVSPVPRGHQHYEGATTSHTRIPGRLLVPLPRSTRPSSLRVRGGLCRCAPAWPEEPCGPGPLVSRCSPWSGAPARGRAWDLTGSLTIHPVLLPRSRTPAGPTRPRLYRSRRCCPRSVNSEGSSVIDFIEAQCWASAPAVYASSAPLPAPHARLAPGWLARLCRRGVEPLGSLRKVSGHLHDLPPSQGLPCRYHCKSFFAWGRLDRAGGSDDRRLGLPPRSRGLLPGAPRRGDLLDAAHRVGLSLPKRL